MRCYPHTLFQIGASANEFQKKAWIADTSDAAMCEYEKLIDPERRAAYDRELNLGVNDIARAVAECKRSWIQVFKYGLLLFALSLVFCSENVIRFYGFCFAPEFKEVRTNVWGDFDVEDGLGRVRRYSEQAYSSEFTSSSHFWQRAFKNDIFLVIFSVVIIILVAKVTEKPINRFISYRIALARARGKDDVCVGRFWTGLVLIAVLPLWASLFAFGYNRVVPVAGL